MKKSELNQKLNQASKLLNQVAANYNGLNGHQENLRLANQATNLQSEIDELKVSIKLHG